MGKKMEKSALASLWYDVVPCCCEDSDCGSHILAVPNLESRMVLVRIKDRRGKACQIYLAPGWARVLAAHMEQAADQLKPRAYAKPTVATRRIRAKAA